MKNEKIQIAIDGPAGSGKGTLATELSKRLNIIYVDTGAMYRTVALYFIQKKIDFEETDKIISELDNIKITIDDKDFSKIYLNGKDVSGKIRTPDVSIGASKVGIIPEVRERLVQIQQEIARDNAVVMEGRDICNVVLPNADLKIFLTATLDVRAERRYKQMLQKGNTDVNLDDVKNDILWRDYNDSHRAKDPLVAKEGTHIIDSTDMSVEQVVAKVMELLGE